MPLASIRQGDDTLDARFPYGVSDLSAVFGREFDAEAFARVPVWIGVGDKNKIEAQVFHFRFDRLRNIEQTAHTALNELRKFILKN